MERNKDEESRGLKSIEEAKTRKENKEEWRRIDSSKKKKRERQRRKKYEHEEERVQRKMEKNKEE